MGSRGGRTDQGMQMVMDEIAAWTQGRFDTDPRFTAASRGDVPPGSSWSRRTRPS